jgi:molybdopterin synthase catalytic subunit
MSVVAELRFETLDPAAELAAVLTMGEGAVVSFVGVARPQSHQGSTLDQLVLEHHQQLTQKSLEEIAADTAGRFDVRHIRVVHRCGAIAPGEPIVFASAASPHRRAAFEAADYLMDRLKTEAIFWKREEGPEGSQWIEPTEADYAARGRWE